MVCAEVNQIGPHPGESQADPLDRVLSVGDSGQLEYFHSATNYPGWISPQPSVSSPLTFSQSHCPGPCGHLADETVDAFTIPIAAAPGAPGGGGGGGGVAWGNVWRVVPGGPLRTPRGSPPRAQSGHAVSKIC